MISFDVVCYPIYSSFCFVFWSDIDPSPHDPFHHTTTDACITHRYLICMYISTIHMYRYYIYLLLLYNMCYVYIIFYTGFAFHFGKPTTLQDSTLRLIYTDGYAGNDVFWIYVHLHIIRYIRIRITRYKHFKFKLNLVSPNGLVDRT